MPKRKLLPQPCPQCGLDYGTCRIIVFKGKPNRVVLAIGHYKSLLYKIPYYYESVSGKTYYNRNSPYDIPAGYKEKVKGRKEWHNFGLNFCYNRKITFGFKSSRLFRLSRGLFYKFRKHGYPIVIDKAHFLRKGGLVKCESWCDCNNIVKSSEIRKFGVYYLCKECYDKTRGLELS